MIYLKSLSVILISLLFVGLGIYVNQNSNIDSINENNFIQQIAEDSKEEEKNYLNQKPQFYSNIITEYNLNHVLGGNINRRGEATGFHHKQSAKNSNTKIISIYKEPNQCDVYVAKVQVDGKTKKAFSSMFPDKLNKNQIVDILISSHKKALEKKLNNNGVSSVQVQTDNCFKINLILDPNKKIITAYPIY
ncbi:MAG: EndoU domain-containing protein [Patescibacteria group bacterium]